MTADNAVKAEREPHDIRALKVLVAEDSSITSDLLKLLLDQRGHQVDIVTDGLQALTALQEHHYDVALLDFHLPHMDGVRVASSIRKVADGRTLPRLIAMTADIEGLSPMPKTARISTTSSQSRSISPRSASWSRSRRRLERSRLCRRPLRRIEQTPT